MHRLPSSVDRWLHIVSGVMWIGLLYYFNVVQVPGLADAAADKGGPGGAGISKYIAPRALWWFRWAAVAHLGDRRVLPAVRLWPRTARCTRRSRSRPAS